MIDIGEHNKLKIARVAPPGLYLQDEEENEVLLPNKYVQDEHKTGDYLTVFVYNDSEDRLVATLEQPAVVLNRFASLKVNQVSSVGAFLDWGLGKDLLVPFSEQQIKMEEGKWYVIFLYKDEKTNRLVGSSKISKHLQQFHITLKPGDEVELMVYQKTDLGYKVIINEEHDGLLYANEVFREIKPGDKLDGYVKKVRPDNKIDVTLQKSTRSEVDILSAQLLEQLQNNKGFLPYTDRSDAETIYATFKVSKKVFKKALGFLYKKRKITISDEGIMLKKNG